MKKEFEEFIKEETELISLLVREKIAFDDFCYRRGKLLEKLK